MGQDQFVRTPPPNKGEIAMHNIKYTFLAFISYYITNEVSIYGALIWSHLVGFYLPGAMEDMVFLVYILICLLIAVGKEW